MALEEAHYAWSDLMNFSAQDVVLVIGAGIMGTGIAQVAAQAGHRVFLFDTRPDAAASAKLGLGKTLESLIGKGKITAASARNALALIEPIETLTAAASARIAIEAIVENLEAKRALFCDLEDSLSVDAVLATNTSSISVTAIANGLRHPERLVGMHFFNPVPLMRLVEVVSGLQTSPQVADAIFELSRAWGKAPVHAKSTPGFIVNRIARPYYAETLALLQEQASTPLVLDACLRAVGFRMGPCELMDLIGHDTNFSVTQSVYEANFFDKRFVPSLVQRELVDAGLLGRKTGQGFYSYPRVAAAPEQIQVDPIERPDEVSVSGVGPLAEALHRAAFTALARFDLQPKRVVSNDWIGLQIDGARLVMTDGRTAQDVAREFGLPDIAVFDRLLSWGSDIRPRPLGFAVNSDAGQMWKSQSAAWLKALGFEPLPLRDTPGLVVARTIAMLVNEAADAVNQGVCTADGADIAMKLGVNYPSGPFEWLAGWSPQGVVQVLRSLDDAYRGERYRVSPWLRQAAASAAYAREVCSGLQRPEQKPTV